MPDHFSLNLSPGRASAIINVTLFYEAFTYAYFHKWLSISRRAHMGQASLGQRPLLSQERSSCAGRAGRAGSAARPGQRGWSEDCLGSPTGPSPERCKRTDDVTDGEFFLLFPLPHTTTLTFKVRLLCPTDFSPRKHLQLWDKSVARKDFTSIE